MATKKTTAKKTSAKATKPSAVAEVTKQQRVALKLINDSLDSAQGLAKKTYLASLGVVGRSFDEIKARYSKTTEGVSTRYEKITVESQEFVKDLVDRGEKVQGEAGDLIKDSRASVEEQIETAKKRLEKRLGGLVSIIDVPARLQDVSNKLESLSKDLKKSA
ncbi:hypothetical protein N9060_02290 [Arenicella sp.]|nr:hypothetical protein [Arenicella sp.]